MIDIGINNNSDQNLLITRVLLQPEWLYAGKWMGETPIAKNYDVSVDGWFSAIDGVVTADALGQEYEDRYQTKIDEDGFWIRPDPLEVKEIPGNKYTIPQNAQERFTISMGLAETYKFLYGTMSLEIQTDQGVTLRSEPFEIAVCYYPSPEAANVRRPNPILTINPTAIPGHVVSRYAWNHLAIKEADDLSVEIARVVLAESSAGLDFQPPESSSPGGRTVGELIFVVKNNRKEPVTVWPFQGEMGLLEEEPPYEKPVIIGTFGDYINGDLPPGFSGTGGFWFTFKTTPVSEITGLFLLISGTNSQSFDLIYRIDLSDRQDQPLPADMLVDLQ